MTIAIWWIRRDLRLIDNRALDRARSSARSVVPLYILDDRLLQSPRVSNTRTAFLLGGLAALDRELRALGSRLVIRRGRPDAVLSELLAELQTESPADSIRIYAEADGSPFAKRRDLPLTQTLPLTLVDGAGILDLARVRKADGAPYTVYTPFSKRWKELLHTTPLSLIPAPDSLVTPETLASISLPRDIGDGHPDQFTPGALEAERRLRAFTGGMDAPIFRYAQDRNRPDLAGTSQVSPYLRFGMLSPRQAASAALAADLVAPDVQAAKGAQVWLDELIWRDFYLSILDNFPHVLGNSFRQEYDRIRWRDDDAAFAAWCEGRTGYPIVDAAMRQLRATGWMHNRTRMIVASFLVKDLLIDWRRGERWFMQHLVDGDPAANNGGWQWAAGTGTDAAPYFRIFNPVLQGLKFDPEGEFVRRWVPELARLSAPAIHEPWRLSHADQLHAGLRIGRDYPMPIVDHQAARQRTLTAYQAALGGDRALVTHT